MKILAIDTSCDETAAAVTEDAKILSNIIWSQASLHAKFGGVMPSLAQREHQEHIGFVVDKATMSAFPKSRATCYELLATKIDAIAVTIGPGLSIALGVGIEKAKELAKKYNKPLIPINHVESHLLSSMAMPRTENLKLKIKNLKLPAYGLCVSGKNTELVLIEDIGKYKILADVVDDALGEAIDKAARMLGLGYPGGAILEKFAKMGNPNKFTLPIPLIGQEKRQIFSYSGLKASLFRLIEKNKQSLAKSEFGKKENPDFPTKQDIYDLAASFQDVAFKHVERVVSYCIKHNTQNIKHFLLGGGVAVNTELRKRIRKICKDNDTELHIPYSKKLYGDNAAMIGVCAYLRNKDLNADELMKKYGDLEEVNRDPRLKI